MKKTHAYAKKEDHCNSGLSDMDSYFRTIKEVNENRSEAELAEHYGSIDNMFKKDVEKVECGDSKHTSISDNKDQKHGEKHFCSECIFCAMLEPDEDDQKTMCWAYKWKCLKTNLTLTSPDACEVCDKFVSKEDEYYNNYLKAVEKPPLGIKPPYIFASERISDIC